MSINKYARVIYFICTTEKTYRQTPCYILCWTTRSMVHKILSYLQSIPILVQHLRHCLYFFLIKYFSLLNICIYGSMIIPPNYILYLSKALFYRFTITLIIYRYICIFVMYMNKYIIDIIISYYIYILWKKRFHRDCYFHNQIFVIAIININIFLLSSFCTSIAAHDELVDFVCRFASCTEEAGESWKIIIILFDVHLWFSDAFTQWDQLD